MGFNPKDAIDAARDIVHNSLDIATYAVERTKEVFTGDDADAE